MKKMLFTFLALLYAFGAMAQCNPQFTWSASANPGFPVMVSFTNTTTFTPPVPTSYASYTLHYGDNSAPGYFFNGTQVHSYANPGTYNAIMVMRVYDSVTSQLLCIDSIVQPVTVGPPCYTTFDIQNLGSGFYTFTANTPSGSAGTSYSWNFGDGSPAETGYTTSHIYTTSGWYAVTLTATKDSCVYVRIDSLLANAMAPTLCDSLNAYISVTATGSLTRNFHNASTSIAGLTNNAQWHFGDGSTSTLNNPSHTYASAGTYYVYLVNTWKDSATNAVVCADSTTLPVTIAPALNMCDSLYASITSAYTGPLTLTFQNTSIAVAGINNVSQWYFGDGSSSTLTNPTHTYAAPGTYNITLVNIWRDSATNTMVCIDSVTQPLTLGPVSMCDSLDAYIQITPTGPLSIDVQNNSSTIVGLSNHAYWSFGDGGTSTLNNASHTYASPGTYYVYLINTWKDSANNVVCADSTTQPYTIGNPATNEISGNIYWDSLSVSAYDSFKVWLIKYDSLTNNLHAVDSTLTAGAFYTASYSFGAHPAGSYRIKAASLNSVPGTSGLVPTYHISSLYWNTATVVNHGGGASLNKNIWMMWGTVPTGPGFIAGNISMGAGRGTSTGVPGLLVFLRNNSNEVISSAYTDADGDFKFEHIPMGTYTVYPEQMNYATTAAAVTIGNGQISRSGIDFEQTESEILPKNVTSLKDLRTQNDIKVYPNPFRNQITIDNAAGNYSQVLFITVTGQTVYKQNIKQGNNLISTTGLTPGVYFLLINGKDTTGRLTVTKQ